MRAGAFVRCEARPLNHMTIIGAVIGPTDQVSRARNPHSLINQYVRSYFTYVLDLLKICKK